MIASGGKSSSSMMMVDGVELSGECMLHVLVDNSESDDAGGLACEVLLMMLYMNYRRLRERHSFYMTLAAATSVVHMKDPFTLLVLDAVTKIPSHHPAR